jgi:hypothetical protein
MTAPTSNAQNWPSVDDQPPEEEGGPIARTGFSYQDEVTVAFFIEMLTNPKLLKIHCETHDDILLTWESENGIRAEFVQVKGGEPDKLWSVADICQKPGNKQSIFEASLSRDKYKEESYFRIVTNRSVVSALNPITYELGSTGRSVGDKGYIELSESFKSYFPSFFSKKGNNFDFWLERCLWDVRHDKVSLSKINTLSLLKLSSKNKLPLLPEQCEVLLVELRQWAKTAGEAKWIPNRDLKIITRTQLQDWWCARETEIRDGALASGGGKLAQKLNEIHLSEESINLAIDMRLNYAAEVRTPKYMAEDETEKLQQVVKSRLMMLRTKYMAGLLPVNEIDFFLQCSELMEKLNECRPDGVQDQLAFLLGCMYDITDRCLHRFSRPSV